MDALKTDFGTRSKAEHKGTSGISEARHAVPDYIVSLGIADGAPSGCPLKKMTAYTP